ncbi:MAG: aminotransferase class V-fold PLP-dependent enzyme [Planctomycetota bacterium]
MTTARRIYLDNASTSWPKPELVYAAVDAYQRNNGASAGRSTYREATEARTVVERTRRAIRELLGGPQEAHVAFGCNGTDALNLCLYGCLGEGDHVVTSELEHNSVLRPLQDLAERRKVKVSFAATDERGVAGVDQVRAVLQSETQWVILNHVSNVTGAVQPIAEIGELCRSRGVRLMVDAAQSLGHFPVDVTALGVDLLAASGHKGLLGPLGTGVVYFAPGIGEQVLPWRHGGTGSDSEQDRQPTTLPERFEAGNLNMVGVSGLEAGVGVVARQLEEFSLHERALTTRLVEGLREIDQLRVFGHTGEATVGLVSFVSEVYDPQELSMLLETQGRIQVRSGLHCAPRIHKRLATLTSGGTVRVSLGPFNSDEDVDALLAMLRELHPPMSRL